MDNVYYLPIYSHPYYSKKFNKKILKICNYIINPQFLFLYTRGLTLKNQIYIKRIIEKFLMRKKFNIVPKILFLTGLPFWKNFFSKINKKASS